MKQLLEILESLKPGVDFRKEKHLVDDHILTSMEIMMLAARISDEMDVEITLPWIRPENFQSAETIMDMIERIEEDI